MSETEEILALLRDPKNRFDPAFIQRMIDLIDPIVNDRRRPTDRASCRVCEPGIRGNVHGSLATQV